MELKFENVLPQEIEQRSFEIITEELGTRELDAEQSPIIKRVIHTTADFDYAEQLYFSPGAVKTAVRAVKDGISFVTDTQMAKAGIRKRTLEQFGGKVFCFMSDEDVMKKAQMEGTTRAVASMEKAAGLQQPLIFVVGNAPTALIKLYEMIKAGILTPAFLIAAPVGFVNVVQAKELILSLDIPCIVARGRKGGSNVAAAICNALLIEAEREKGNTL